MKIPILEFIETTLKCLNYVVLQKFGHILKEKSQPFQLLTSLK